MAKDIEKVKFIPVERIFLDHKNPRHASCESEGEVIEHLCKDELVYELAKDIAKRGLNPLELIALVPEGDKRRESTNYCVVEGNRRICAIKLLNDPDLAPASCRRDFERIVWEVQKISEVQATVFTNRTEVAIWLDRIHGGLQDGVGRKPWSAEQKTRHIGNPKNAFAQRILDYAENEGIISVDDRKKKLTTVQRYLGNPLLREALGVDNSDKENVARNRPKKDFDILLSKFLEDLKNGTVNSRSNAKNIEEYSRQLGGLKELTGDRVEAEPIVKGTSSKTPEYNKPKLPKEPNRPKRLNHDDGINDKLKFLGNLKLDSIYYSICNIYLEKHTPLIAVGVWVFIESLTAMLGRKANTDFHSFLSVSKLEEVGFVKGEAKALREALKRLSEAGNTTKHHERAASFAPLQLYNDVETLNELISKLCDEAANARK